MDDDRGRQCPLASAAAAAAAPAVDEPPQARLRWLFRDALRQQRFHPLMDLLRRYREEDTP